MPSTTWTYQTKSTATWELEPIVSFILTDGEDYILVGQSEDEFLVARGIDGNWEKLAKS